MQGLTVGRDIYLAADARRGPSHDRVLAHELAHAAQQTRCGIARLQPKLKLTGKPVDVQRTITLLNSGLSGYRVSIDKGGNVSVVQNFVELAPNTSQQALADRLTNIVSDTKDVLISISSGTATIIGSYVLGDIDIADAEMVGVVALIHEIEEQYQKQVKGLPFGSETSGAHGEGIKAESDVRGAIRGPQNVISSTQNPDGTIDAVIEIPWTYPGGKVVKEVLTIKRSNVVSRTTI